MIPPLDEATRAAITLVRIELAFWGIDTTHLTDEDMIEQVRQMAQMVADAGITADEAAQAFQMAGRAMRENDE